MSEANSNYQSVTKRLSKIKELLNGETANADNVAATLFQLHPDIPESEIMENVLKMKSGVSRLFTAETKETGAAAEQAILAQTQGMTEEQQKGYLLQLFELIKKSDETIDPDIKAANVNSSDIAQISTDELRTLVAEQMSNAVLNLTHDVLEADIDKTALSGVSLKTEEDALLLAAAQYSAACDGEIKYEYAKIPEVLGACAAAQAKIVVYCEGIMATDMNPDDKKAKIMEYVLCILGYLVAVVAVVLLSIGVATLSAFMFVGLEALLGMGVIALIFECLMIVPIVYVSFGAVCLALYGIGAGLNKLATDVLAPRFPKFKEFYSKFIMFFSDINPFEDETEDSEYYNDKVADFSEMDDEDDAVNIAYQQA